ncbi:MAG: hypothetical protein U0794_07640 [Isosphaeraceae bacterium]
MGVELSEPMLRVVAAKAREQGVQVAALREPMRPPDPP